MTTRCLGCYCNSHIQLSPGEKKKAVQAHPARKWCSLGSNSGVLNSKAFCSSLCDGQHRRQSLHCLLPLSFAGLPILGLWLDSLRNIFSRRFRDVCNLGKCRQFVLVSLLWMRQSETLQRRERQSGVHVCSDNLIWTHGQKPGRKVYLTSGKHIWIICLWEANSTGMVS